VSRSNWKFPTLIVLGLVIVIWDFTRLFSSWVVASQREAGVVTLVSFLCGLLPIVGFAACCMRRKWGAWILLVSPWIASLGLLGIHVGNGDWLLFILLFVLPTSVLGFLFQRLLGTQSVAAAP
jgi:CDP-diglyceride synthetase